MKNHKQIMAAVLSTRSITEAAKAAGVSERTIYNYLHDEMFLKEYTEINESTVKAAAGQIQRGMTEAVNVLLDITADKKASHQARAAAARTILDYGLKSYELLQLIPRIEELERIAKNELREHNIPS